MGEGTQSRRGRIIIAAVAGTVAIVVALAAVPVTRGAIGQLLCDLTGVGCGLPTQSSPQEREPAPLIQVDPSEAATWGHYAALGDSYTSGDGADDYVSASPQDEECYRSANAYPQQLVGRYAFSGGLSVAACSGTLGSTIVSDPDAEQFGEITELTSLVTVGIGGNDLGFTDVMTSCMVRVPILDRDACTGQQSEIEQRRAEFFDTTFDDILAEARDRAPDARLLVVGYPRIFPSDPSGMYYTLNAQDQVWLNDMIDVFNDELRDAVTEADSEIADDTDVGSVEYVEVTDAFHGHEVGTDSAWVHGVLFERGDSLGVSVDRSTFHPTADGQRALAEKVATQIGEGPERDLYVTRDTIDQLGPEVMAALDGL